MAEIPVTNENPLTMEQRMERPEGSFSQILDLLKTVIPAKEVREEEAKMMDKMEMDIPSWELCISTSKQCFLSQQSIDLPKSTLSAKKERVKIDPVPIPYSDLYDTLLQQHLVAPEVPQPVSNPPPKWYNPAEACKYHMGAPGHSIEKCLTFKLRVQRLRDAGQLFFEEGEGKSTGTSINKDPLLKH
ncbi:hypothetical protein SESBI_14621 [Sesbania bispinosa]|nr:hypothetical protein SESBI_14621 [Sesbania bispinosa]